MTNLLFIEMQTAINVIMLVSGLIGLGIYLARIVSGVKGWLKEEFTTALNPIAQDQREIKDSLNQYGDRIARIEGKLETHEKASAENRAHVNQLQESVSKIEYRLDSDKP